MNDNEKIIQQEIAPLVISEEINEPLPVEKEKKATAFLKLKPTQKLIYIAIFITVAIVLKRFSITLGGSKLSFLYIPVYLAGAMLGPIGGFAVGAVGDVLGHLWSSSGGMPNFIVTLGNGLMGGIMGFVFYIKKGNYSLKLVIGALLALLVCTLGVNTIGLQLQFSLEGVKYLDGGGFFKSWWNTLIYPLPGAVMPRIAFQPIVVIINLALTIPVYMALRKISFSKLV